MPSPAPCLLLLLSLLSQGAGKLQSHSCWAGNSPPNLPSPPRASVKREPTIVPSGFKRLPHLSQSVHNYMKVVTKHERSHKSGALASHSPSILLPPCLLPAFPWGPPFPMVPGKGGLL